MSHLFPSSRAALLQNQYNTKDDDSPVQTRTSVLNACTFTGSRKSSGVKIQHKGTLQPSSLAKVSGQRCPRAAGWQLPPQGHLTSGPRGKQGQRVLRGSRWLHENPPDASLRVCISWQTDTKPSPRCPALLLLFSQPVSSFALTCPTE